MTAPFVLHTARLHLRRITDANLDDLVTLDSDPAVMRFISDGKPTPRQVYTDTLLARMKAYADEPYGFAAAYEAQRFVGWFHLRPSVADGAVLELGYRLRQDTWGRGLATEGSRALLKYAFGELDRTVVDACVVESNAGSIAVLRKCGMQRIGRFVHPRGGMEVEHYCARRR
ncbi:MAG: GNAT family N-acetyltransferase [Nannocystaceae bacterium]|nr:GNAT family N-acetyltransferase [Nannocystaceae bacterium]